MSSEHAPKQISDVVPGGFHTTPWTLVIQAQEQSEKGLDALRDLCAAYYAPVIAFLRRHGRDVEAARDLAHEFFAEILKGDAIGGADRVQGRFRSYLLGAVKHFLAHRWEAEQRLRRGGGIKPFSIEGDAHSPALDLPTDGRLSPERAFDRQWAVTVLTRALAALQEECLARGKSTLFEKARPWLIGDSVYGDQAALAESLGLSATATKVAVHRLKRDFRRLVKAEVACTLREKTEVEDEMRALFAALAG